MPPTQLECHACNQERLQQELGGWDGTGRGLGLGVGVWQGTAWRLPEESEREGVEIKAERKKKTGEVKRGTHRLLTTSQFLPLMVINTHQQELAPSQQPPCRRETRGRKREEMEERATTCYINKRKEMYESKRKVREKKSSMLTTAT